MLPEFFVLGVANFWREPISECQDHHHNRLETVPLHRSWPHLWDCASRSHSFQSLQISSLSTSIRSTCKTVLMSVCKIWSHLRAVISVKAVCHHGLCAAGALWRLVEFLLLFPGSHQQKHKHKGNDSQDKTQQNSYDHYHVIVLCVFWLGPCGNNHVLDVNFGPGLVLAAALQSHVQDVGSSLILCSDLLGQSWNVANGPSGTWGVVLSNMVVLNTPFSNASVGVVSGADGVYGMDVPLPAHRYLEHRESIITEKQ